MTATVFGVGLLGTAVGYFTGNNPLIAFSLFNIGVAFICFVNGGVSHD